MKIQYTRKIILKNTANQITLSDRTAEAISDETTQCRIR